jgi:ABC-2 type transport system permease protein
MLNAFRTLVITATHALVRDPTMLFWTFLFPIFFLAVMTFSYGNGPLGSVTIEVVDRDHSTSSARYVADIHRTFSGDLLGTEIVAGDPAAPLSSGRIRVTIPAGFAADIDKSRDTRVTVEYGGMAARLAAEAFSLLTGRFNAELGHQPMPVKLDVEDRSGRIPIGFPGYMVTGVLVMAIMTSGLNTTCVAIATMREQNTFKLLSCMPVSPASFLLALLVTRMVLFFLSSIFLLCTAPRIVDFQLDLDLSRIVNTMAVAAIGGLSLLSLGLALAARAATAQSANFICAFVNVALLFLSDLTMPLRSFSPLLRDVLTNLPTAHFVASLRAVLLQGASLTQEWRSLAVMLLWTAGFLAVARLGFRWQGA